MGNWTHSRCWRFRPKTFCRNDLHDLKILLVETSESPLRSGISVHLPRGSLPQGKPRCQEAYCASGMNAVRERSAPELPPPHLGHQETGREGAWRCLVPGTVLLTGGGRFSRLSVWEDRNEQPMADWWRERSGKELLAAWPLRRLANWVAEVNAPQTEAELAALRRSVDRGCPFGEALWSDQIVRRLGLESTLRPHGRPKKHENGS